MTLNEISDRLSSEIGELRFSQPITHVYNPLAYARIPHQAYLDRYGKGTREAIFMGMNPGPFGMAQNGVPFGDTTMVRDWLGIAGEVSRPKLEHPKRPVTGLACARSEVSGTRFWGWARERFGRPEIFFKRFFVWNYCPLCFMEESGKNFTPDKLPVAEREVLYAACDTAVRDACAVLKPKHAIGVGAFAESRLRAALAGTDIRVGTILHPSPASPIANRGWAPAAEVQLRAMGIELP